MFGDSSNAGDLGYNGFPISLNYFTALPDPSSLSDSNATIIFKSLLKKDAITKEKSLNDLISYLAALPDVEEYLIISWLQVYPKLAIDNARSVRVLAHQAQAKMLEQVGGRAFAKYLKSCIPIWLMGTLDSDSYVALQTYKGLLAAFQSDKERVDSKLWVLFHEPIFNFISAAVQQETHESLSDSRYTKEDDSIAKYDRVLCAVLAMVTRLVVALPEQTVLNASFESVIALPLLWDRLGLFLETATLNLALFKTLLVLIKVVFSSKAVTAAIDVKLLYKTVLKKFLKLVKFPKTANPIVYSGIILQFWDTLVVLTNAPARQLEWNGAKLKKNFWELGPSDAKTASRFKSYLKMGHCNLNPTYYSIVGHLILLLATIDTCQFLLEDRSEILDLVAAFKTSSPEYREKSLACVLKVFYALEEGQDVLEGICVEVFAAPAMRTGSLTKVLGEFFTQNNIDTKALFDSLNKKLIAKALTTDNDPELAVPTNLAVESYLNLLHDSNSVLHITLLAEGLVDGLEEALDLETPTSAFYILSRCIPHLAEPILESIQEFFDILASYVEEEFVELPLALLETSIKHCTQETVGDFFVKLTMVAPEKIPVFLVLVMDSFPLDSNPEIMEYVNKLSQSENNTAAENKIVFKFLHKDDQILDNLFARAKNSNEDGLKFLDALVKSNKVDDFEDLGFLYAVCWKNITSQSAQSVFSKGSDEKKRASLFQYILTAQKFGPVSEYLSQHTDSFPYTEIVDFISSAVVDVGLLSIANPLEQNIYLSTNNGTLALSIKEVESVGKFLLECDFQNEYICACVGLVSEYLADVNFTLAQEEPKTIHDDENTIDPISALQMALLRTFEKQSETSLSNIFGDEGLIGLVGNSYFVYFTRLYKRILTNALESASVQEFESLFNVDLPKLANSSPLKLSAVLMACTKFFTLSTKFDRVRNFVFAEIIGVRGESKILIDGIKWVALSINFLNAEIDAGELYSPVPPPRLMMVLNTLNQFLDSSIAYDEEFIPMRCLLAKFFTGYLKFANADTPLKLFDLAIQVLQDNLATIQTEPTNYQLRYFTLKLFVALNNSKALYIDAWKESEMSLLEEVLEVLVNDDIQKSDKATRNQAVALCHEVLGRIFSGGFPINLLNSKIDQLYELLHSDSLSLQRLAVNLLHKLILANQQEFVIEYQLQKKAIINEENDELRAKLPLQLLSMMADVPFEDFIEFESHTLVAQYLWAWTLVFDHFEDITYSIRNDYNEQLKQTGAVEKLLNFIFQQVDVTDEKLLGKLSGDFSHSTTDSWIGESFFTEIKLTLIKLYYLSLEHFGFEASRWYNGIRDFQLKRKIEVFTLKYISSLLVDKILNDVSNNVDLKKVSGATDEHIMTLKVNKTTNDIKTIYVIDEQTMEMVVKVPDLYPLHGVKVEGPSRLGVKPDQWKAWLLASQRVISLTNGSISEAIELFNRNVNLHFSGFEECAICYSILHQDHSLPSKNCPVCQNKFHGACLYKWFKSSGSSTCPLCRSTFNFSRRS